MELEAKRVLPIRAYYIPPGTWRPRMSWRAVSPVDDPGSILLNRKVKLNVESRCAGSFLCEYCRTNRGELVIWFGVGI
ncbi:MAG: hypothetical protein ACLUD2_09155 [Clostridium sp.]